jgi:hypothetical protein
VRLLLIIDGLVSDVLAASRRSSIHQREKAGRLESVV